MGQKYMHPDVMDKGLQEIQNAATAANLEFILIAAYTTTPAEVTGLFSLADTANKRLSDRVAVASGDLTLQNRAGGGRELAVAQKTGSVAVAQDKTLYSGTASAGGATTLSVSGTPWTTGKWVGYKVVITGGTGSGQSKRITANTSSQLTVDSAWTTNPDGTSIFEIRFDLHLAWYDKGGAGRVLILVEETTDQSMAAVSNPLPFPAHAVGFSNPV